MLTLVRLGQKSLNTLPSTFYIICKLKNLFFNNIDIIQNFTALNLEEISFFFHRALRITSYNLT